MTKSAIVLITCAAALTAAVTNPVDFGMAEFNAAVAARNLKVKPKITAELNLDPPESWRIDTYASGSAHITGGDLRGLMYALLEAADQIRATGKLKIAKGSPAVPIRGVRVDAQPSAPWFASAEFWRGYSADLARSRFNRVQLVFTTAPGERDMPILRMISQTAAEFGVDVVVGLGEVSPVSLERLVEDCPGLHSVTIHQLSAAADAGPLFRVLHSSGRRIVLELPAGTGGTPTGPVRYFEPYADASDLRPADFYLEMDSAQLGFDEDRVRALLSGLGSGFEIPSPVNASGRPDPAKIALWGKLGYSPK